MGQFDEGNGKPAACAVCEAMLPDAVDGLLTEAEQKAFDKHVAGCTACSLELEEAQRGAAWMAMLKGHTPEPPAALLQRILAETTGAGSASSAAAAPSAAQSAPRLVRMPERTFLPETPLATGGRLLAFRQRMTDTFSVENARAGFQPRLLMTAAMAFFSIALTLNMTGIKLGDLRTASLRPSSLRRTVADVGASATRSFQNLRVVYQVESSVSEFRNGGFSSRDQEDGPGALRHAGDAADQKQAEPANAAPKPGSTDDKQDKKVPQGSSELQFPVITDAAAARKEI